MADLEGFAADLTTAASHVAGLWATMGLPEAEQHEKAAAFVATVLRPALHNFTAVQESAERAAKLELVRLENEARDLKRRVHGARPTAPVDTAPHTPPSAPSEPPAVLSPLAFTATVGFGAVSPAPKREPKAAVKDYASASRVLRAEVEALRRIASQRCQWLKDIEHAKLCKTAGGLHAPSSHTLAPLSQAEPEEAPEAPLPPQRSQGSEEPSGASSRVATSGFASAQSSLLPSGKVSSATAAPGYGPMSAALRSSITELLEAARTDDTDEDASPEAASQGAVDAEAAAVMMMDMPDLQEETFVATPRATIEAPAVEDGADADADADPAPAPAEPPVAPEDPHRRQLLSPTAAPCAMTLAPAGAQSLSLLLDADDLTLDRIHREASAAAELIGAAETAQFRDVDALKEELRTEAWPELREQLAALMCPSGPRSTFAADEAAVGLEAAMDTYVSRLWAKCDTFVDTPDPTAATPRPEAVPAEWPGCIAALYGAAPRPDAVISVLRGAKRQALCATLRCWEHRLLAGTAQLRTAMRHYNAQCGGDPRYARLPEYGVYLPERHRPEFDLEHGTTLAPPAAHVLDAFVAGAGAEEGGAEGSVERHRSEIDRVRRGVDTAADEAATLKQRGAKLAEILPQLQRRHEVMEQWSQLEAIPSKDRLMSRKGNQAQSMLHEQRVKQSMKHMPQLEGQLLTKLEEWEALFGPQLPLIFYGADVKAEIVAALDARKAEAAAQSPPPRSRIAATRGTPRQQRTPLVARATPNVPPSSAKGRLEATTARKRERSETPAGRGVRGPMIADRCPTRRNLYGTSPGKPALAKAPPAKAPVVKGPAVKAPVSKAVPVKPQAASRTPAKTAPVRTPARATPTTRPAASRAAIPTRSPMKR